MNIRSLPYWSLVLMAVVASEAGAETARQLSDFTAIEEPTVRYVVADDKFEPDEFVNITDQGDGIVRMTLRYESQQWDGDRNLQIKDRQRAEVKGLGALQKDGETFEYATTWRTSADLRGSDRFCHVFQLKATDGDKAPPLIVLSILKEPGVAAVRYCSGKQSGFKVVREFPWKPAAWQTVKIRVKVSASGEGEILVSVDGGAFVGTSGIPVFRPDATKYRPKWGFYRGVRPGMALQEDYVEHREASAARVLPTAVQPR